MYTYIFCCGETDKVSELMIVYYIILPSLSNTQTRTMCLAYCSSHTHTRIHIHTCIDTHCTSTLYSNPLKTPIALTNI